MSMSLCHLLQGTTLQNSQIFSWSRLCPTASSQLGLFTPDLEAGFCLRDANLTFPIPSAPFPPPGLRPSFSEDLGCVRELNLERSNFCRCLGCRVSPPAPYPLHLLCCELLCFSPRGTLRKLLKMVARGLVPAEGSGGAQGGAVPCPRHRQGGCCSLQ